MDAFSSYKVKIRDPTCIISTTIADSSRSVDNFIYKMWDVMTEDSDVTILRGYDDDHGGDDDDHEQKAIEVIGLAVEYCDDGDGSSSSINTSNKIATLQLCWGSCHGILIQLLHLKKIPNSLKDLLADDDGNIAFVGVGIRDALAKLEMDYGLKCKIAIELGPMASRVCKKPQFFDSTLEALADEIAGFKIEKSLIPSGSLWGARDLRTEQIDYAIAKAHASYRIGYKLTNMELKNK